MPERLSSERASSAVEAVIAEGDLPVLPISFIPIDDYTTFRAEFAIVGGDIVYHFYVTEEVQKLPDHKAYWFERFPEAMQSAADTHFKVGFPRLKAQYVPEMASWWMRAFGFGKVLDPHRFSFKFFDSLDALLDREIPKAT
jgi:hypothetical protein